MDDRVELDDASPDQIERANAAVCANLNEDGCPKWDASFGYACALTAIMQTDALTTKSEVGPIDDGWQPIETAPKDGTEIDVWVHSFELGAAGRVTAKDIGRRTNVRWGKQVETYTGPYECRESDDDGWIYYDTPHWLFLEVGTYRITHWRPLPTPPRASLNTQEKAE